MLLSLLSIVAMAVMFVYMACHAKMKETRRMLWVPAASCGMELLAMGMLSATNFPLLTALLVVLRLALLGCCAAAMRRDAAMVRARARRRAKLARELHAALNPLHEIPAAHAAGGVVPLRAGSRIA